MQKLKPSRLFTSLTAVLLLLSLVFGLSACGRQPAALDNPTYELTILATNDLHGHIDTLPEYLTIINQVRTERDHVLLLDAGDVFRRGPYQEYQGSVEIALFNRMGYDALVLGNNEFKVPDSPDSKGGAGTLEESDAQLADIIRWASFPVLCGNVTLKGTGAYIEGTLPYVIAELGELRIGIIGVTHMQPAENKLEMAADKTFARGDLAVKQLLPEVREASDIQIVLSHAGLSTDKKMKNVSAVIGGHDHSILENYKNRHGVPVTQAGGEDDHRLSRLDLTFALIDGAWVLQTSRGTLYTADGETKDPALIIPEIPSNPGNS